MSYLDLTVLPFQEITQEQAESIETINLKFYYAYAKKPKKNTNQVEIKMEDFEPTTITISGNNLTSLNAFYNFIKISCHLDKKFLLFANSPDHNIGSGFVSSHLHFASFILLGIQEFLIVTVNDYNYNRMISGKPMLPRELTNVMNGHSINVTSVNDIITQHRTQRENEYVEMTNLVNNLPTRTVNPINEQTNEYPITKITVWKRYAPLLCSINNICFSIDEHFNNISRTTTLKEDVVKEICTDILSKHRNEDQS